jgi:lipopolysaccharide export system protein LptA
MYRGIRPLTLSHTVTLILLSVVFSVLALPVHSQESAQIEILNANSFEGDESLGKDVSRLLGDVRFRHRGAIMRCDSAYLYQQTNSLKAFGRIVITKGDSIRLTGDHLEYYGDEGKAVVTGDVILSDRKMNLYTSNLTYNLDREVAYFVDGGKVVDQENVLTSNSGKFLSSSGEVYFQDSVQLKNPSYYLESDTLSYNTRTDVSTFHGPTRIYSLENDSSFIYCSKGWYNSSTQRSYFGGDPFINSGTRTVSADSLLYDNKELTGRGFGNVLLVDTLEKLSVGGDIGYTNDRQRVGWVTGKALLQRSFEYDTLFVHADTLFASEDTAARMGRWKAYHGVKFYKSDLQGKCDSISYDESDSLMRMFNDPIIWSEENQLTSDSVMFLIYDDEMQQLLMRGNSFICSTEGGQRYNQVKGRDMTGYFSENSLSEIFVSGNGQSIYYTRNSEDELTGVNRADCSDMLIRIEENSIREIALLYQPDATLYPLDELSPTELRLHGFEWRAGERPASREDIFK